ncbi:MAG: hypothetical protein Q9162_004276 [Coniocarpon cinnabarinum]
MDVDMDARRDEQLSLQGVQPHERLPLIRDLGSSWSQLIEKYGWASLEDVTVALERQTGFRKCESLRLDVTAALGLIYDGSWCVVPARNAPEAHSTDGRGDFMVTFKVPKGHGTGTCPFGPSYEHPWQSRGDFFERIRERLSHESNLDHENRIQRGNRWDAQWDSGEVNVADLMVDLDKRAFYTMWRIPRQCLVAVKHPGFVKPKTDKSATGESSKKMTSGHSVPK